MRKFLSLFLVLSVLIFLGGCEKKNQNAGLLAAGEKLKLQIWTVGHAEFLRALGAEFQKAAASPGLSVQVVEFESDAELQRFLFDKMAENSGPDLVFSAGHFVSQNLSKLTPREGDEAFTPAAFKNTFVRSANETCLQNGKIYCAPMGVDSLAIFYNVEHLIDRLSDRNEPGANWNQIQKDASELAVADNSFRRFARAGIAIGRADNVFYTFEILQNIAAQMGISFFSTDGAGAEFLQKKVKNASGKSEYLMENAVNLLTRFADARSRNFTWSEFMAEPADPNRNFQSFVDGDVSMIFGYSADWARISNLLESGARVRESDVQVAFFPQFSGEERKIFAEIFVGAVPRTAQKSDVSWRFLKFAVRKNNLQSFFEQSGIPTPRLDLISEQESSEKHSVFVRQAKFARAFGWPKSIKPADFAREIEFLVSEINNSKISILPRLENLQDKISGQMQQYLEREKELSRTEKSEK